MSFNTPQEVSITGANLSVGIVAARYNPTLVDALLHQVFEQLRSAGVKEKKIRIYRVPGSNELPSAAQWLATATKPDVIVALGVIIRGDTLHYDVIANEVTRGIGQAAQETGVPMGFGVLTCDTLEQAIDRAGLKAGNKGWEAALAAVEMAVLQKKAKKKSSKSIAKGAPVQ